MKSTHIGEGWFTAVCDTTVLHTPVAKGLLRTPQLPSSTPPAKGLHAGCEPGVEVCKQATKPPSHGAGASLVVDIWL